MFTGDLAHIAIVLRVPASRGRSLVFDPIELLEPLAALTPRPRINLVLDYGVLGARSAWRSRISQVLAPALSGGW